MSSRHAFQTTDNPFLTAPIGRLFWSNALPMAVVMSMGGFLNLADGIFVGRYIGPDALAAVSLAFPVTMVLTALVTLVGSGMSSLLARHLGAGDRAAGAGVFAGAHGLALVVSGALIVLGLAVGRPLIDAMAAGDAQVAAMARSYLLILLLGAPLQFGLGLHADALRTEGGARLIAGLSVLVNLFNLGANWLAIAGLGLEVAGSALGTVAAQALGLVLLLALRARRPGLLPLASLAPRSWGAQWRAILTLGLPLCLSFLGMAFAASSVILTLRLSAGPSYGDLVAGYGVVTRLLGLAFLPQMAIALATQSISGNNAGAQRLDRAGAALRLAQLTAAGWCLGVTAIGWFGAQALAGWFTHDPQVIAAVTRFLHPMLLLYIASGPILVLALHFQALGQPARTALLTLVKPWLLTPTLVLTLSTGFGLNGLWLAFPLADAGLLLLALRIACQARSQGTPSPGLMGERA